MGRRLRRAPVRAPPPAPHARSCDHVQREHALPLASASTTAPGRATPNTPWGRPAGARCRSSHPARPCQVVATGNATGADARRISAHPMGAHAPASGSGERSPLCGVVVTCASSALDLPQAIRSAVRATMSHRPLHAHHARGPIVGAHHNQLAPRGMAEKGRGRPSRRQELMPHGANRHLPAAAPGGGAPSRSVAPTQ